MITFARFSWSKDGRAQKAIITVTIACGCTCDRGSVPLCLHGRLPRQPFLTLSGSPDLCRFPRRVIPPCGAEKGFYVFLKSLNASEVDDHLFIGDVEELDEVGRRDEQLTALQHRHVQASRGGTNANCHPAFG